MARIEPTLEDWQEYWDSLELDEVYEQWEALRLAEQEEAERKRQKRPQRDYGHQAQECEFGRSENDDYFPD
jgi:hypothetical protein